MKISSSFLAVAALVTLATGQVARAQFVWQQTAGNNFWSVPGNWSPAGPPDAVGAEVVFNPTTGVNTVFIDGDYTVGEITFNLAGSIGNNDHRLDPDPIFPGPIRMDNGGSGATITTLPGGIPNNDIAAEIILDDDVTLDLQQTTNQSAAGSLSIAGAISGNGGVTKTGPGTLTYITGAKTYTGPTEFVSGRIRLRGTVGVPTATSSFRLHSGASIEPGYSGNVAYGTGSIFLNGFGDAVFEGVIRPDRTAATGQVITFPNPVVLESDSSVHSQAQGGSGSGLPFLGSLTFSNTVSGPGGFFFSAAGHDDRVGSYILNGANTYSGGTKLRAGSLIVSGANATLGTGDVLILDGRFREDGSSASDFATRSQLVLETGVLNAIADDAVLTLKGGVIPNIEVQSGINELVGGLVLGATPQPDGVYTAASHPAFITGPGSITVVNAVVGDADFDDDGDVDGNDFLIFQRGVGTVGTPTTGDTDGDSDVDNTDLDNFKAEFGTATVAAGAVPEPATWALVALGLAGMGLVRRCKG